MKKYIWGLLLTILLTGVDQVTKILAREYLANTGGKDIIPGVFRLEYLENRGAAFGILQEQRIMLLFVTFLILAIVIYGYHKIPAGRRFFPMQLILLLITSGALGNMIDRIFRNYVVDFLYFQLIDFPIFNVADCYVVIGSALFMLLVLFYYKDEDFAFLHTQQKGAGDE